MDYIARWECKGDGIPATTWNEPVIDDQYQAPRTRTQ